MFQSFEHRENRSPHTFCTIIQKFMIFEVLRHFVKNNFQRINIGQLSLMPIRRPVQHCGTPQPPIILHHK